MTGFLLLPKASFLRPHRPHSSGLLDDHPPVHVVVHEVRKEVADHQGSNVCHTSAPVTSHADRRRRRRPRTRGCASARRYTGIIVRRAVPLARWPAAADRTRVVRLRAATRVGIASPHRPTVRRSACRSGVRRHSTRAGQTLPAGP